MVETPYCYICYEGEGVCNAPAPPELEQQLPPTAENDLPRNYRGSCDGWLNSVPNAVAAAAAAAEVKRQDAQLVSPCACRGSAAHVHVGCLRAWHAQQTAQQARCPTCEHLYHGDVGLVLARLRLQKVRAEHRRATGQEVSGAATAAVTKSEAKAMDTVGKLLVSSGKFDQALELYQYSLVAKISVEGPETWDVANSLHNIAEAYSKGKGFYRDALTLEKESLLIHNNTLGPSHEATATSLNNMGLALQNMGKHVETEPYFRQAVATYEALNIHDENMASMLNNLAGSYRFQFMLEESQAMYERSLEMRKRVLGPEHTSVAESYNNLAMLLKDAGKFEQAEEMANRCQEIAQKHFDEDDPRLLNYLGNLGVVRMGMSEASEGRELVARALEGLLAQGKPSGHVWVQKFRKHLNGGPVEPGTLLVSSGAVFARETAEAVREAEAEAEATEATNSPKQADATPFCPAHDARMGPSHASPSRPEKLADDNTPRQRLTRSASATAMKKVSSAPAMLSSLSEHHEPQVGGGDGDVSASTPRGSLGATTAAPRAGGLRRVVSAAHLQSIANCRPEVLEAYASAHAPSPLRDDPQTPVAPIAPVAAIPPMRRLSGSKRKLCLNRVEEEPTNSNVVMPVAAAPATDMANALEAKLAAQAAIAAAAAMAARTQTHHAASVNDIFRRLLDAYHMRHQVYTR